MLKLIWHQTNLRSEKIEKVLTWREGEMDMEPPIKKTLKWKSWLLLWNAGYFFFLQCVLFATRWQLSNCHLNMAKVGGQCCAELFSFINEVQIEFQILLLTVYKFIKTTVHMTLPTNIYTAKIFLGL